PCSTARRRAPWRRRWRTPGAWHRRWSMRPGCISTAARCQRCTRRQRRRRPWRWHRGLRRGGPGARSCTAGPWPCRARARGGLAEIRQGLAADLATEDRVYRPYFLGLLAEASGAGGHPDEGLAALAEARAVMDTTAARVYAAELYRLTGALLLQQAVPEAAQAGAWFFQAPAGGRPPPART